MQGMK